MVAAGHDQNLLDIRSLQLSHGGVGLVGGVGESAVEMAEIGFRIPVGDGVWYRKIAFEVAVGFIRAIHHGDRYEAIFHQLPGGENAQPVVVAA